MLNAFASLKCSKKCWHNVQKPIVDLPTDCTLSFLFPAETDVLVPVFSQSTDVVVVNSVVVLKFPIMLFCLFIQEKYFLFG